MTEIKFDRISIMNNFRNISVRFNRQRHTVDDTIYAHMDDPENILFHFGYRGQAVNVVSVNTLPHLLSIDLTSYFSKLV